jgi:lipopolysaccharide export system ATP-binding protein
VADKRNSGKSSSLWAKSRPSMRALGQLSDSDALVALGRFMRKPNHDQRTEPAGPSAKGSGLWAKTPPSLRALGREDDAAPVALNRFARISLRESTNDRLQPAPDSATRAPTGQLGPRLVADNTGLIARNLGKQYHRRPVLRFVSLSVQRGEAVGLLGPNGAGKTTCFYVITGLVAPDYGTITLDDHDITDLPMYRRSRLGIGYLPQEASIFRSLSVENNIRAVLEVVEPIRDNREAILDDLLAEFSITHLRRTPALALSGGERRRVEIARALASRPSFMLLDEPLAGIDPIAVGEIRDLVSHLKDRGIGVLITDHNVRETLDIIDRAYILHDGMVLMEGAPSEIVAHEDVRRVYLGERFSL